MYQPAYSMQQRSWWIIVGLVALAIAWNVGTSPPVLAGAEPAPAEGAADADQPAAEEQATGTEKKKDEAPPRRESYLVWLFKSAGIFFWPQLAISIAVVSIITANIVALLPKKFIPVGYSEQFEVLVKERKFTEAYELSNENPALLCRLIAAGLNRISGGYQEVTRSMEELGAEEDMRFEHRLSYLAMIGNVATMVGLLGTVWGMVAAFMTIGQSDIAPKPSELAKGVSQALVTTVVGLMQAIPAVVAFTILKNLVAKRMLEIGIVSEQLMSPFKGVKPAKPAAAQQSGARPTTAQQPPAKG